MRDQITKLLWNLAKVNLIIFCSTSISNDFFLKVKNWQQPKQINLEAQALKNFEQIKDFDKRNETVYEFNLKTGTGINVPVTFFDRGSDVVIIAGQALPACKEAMAIYADILNTYDVILFDYRWNGKYLTTLLKSFLMRCPTKKILLDEADEVFAVIDFINSKKQYRKIVGLGECYSNYLFAKIQTDQTSKGGKPPFTHLILDSCWYSLRLFAESICADPFLPISPIEGGAPYLLKKITDSKLIKYFLLNFIFGIINDISIDSALSGLTIPVLFIHGLNDLFVPQVHFEKIWNSAPSKFRAAFFTPFRHCDNLHNKLLYSFIAETFISSSSVKDFSSKCFKIL